MLVYGMTSTLATASKVEKPATLTRRILACHRAADAQTRAAGADWYAQALATCQEIADDTGHDLERVVCALACLSPRIHWIRNVYLTRALASGQDRPSGVLGDCWERASRALTAADPWSVFGTRASKTRAFARAILGDPDAVTVDVWAARVAGVDVDLLRTPAGYNRVADAYRRASKIIGNGICPRDLQAVTWCHVRSRAA